MTKAKIRIAFEQDSTEPLVVERDVEFVDLREPGGREFIAQYLLSQADMESRWNRHYLALPDVAIFAHAIKQSFRLDDFMSGAYEDRINTRLMWVELSHVLLRVKVLLAQSKAYHEQELVESLNPGSEAENLKWHLHLDKMKSFDLATILLGKVNELTARLVFERLGASLIPNLDSTKPNWEREITWGNIKSGLANKAENPHLVVIPV